MIDSEAVFSGPNDFTFKITSATAKETFDQLRILYADRDDAEPSKPRWVDVSVEPQWSEYWERSMSRAEFDKRVPHFDGRTLHAWTDAGPRIFVVALKDPSIARDRFVADVSVTAKPEPESVMEGRGVSFTFTIRNNGPATATGVTFRSYIDPELISLNQSQGVCRWEAHNIYCNLGEIKNGASATITFHGQCAWNFFYDDKPAKSGGMDATPLVSSAEADPNYENNQLFVSASVVKDPNKAPVVQIISPTQDQLFVGPGATIKIAASAHDPDGSVDKVEFFDRGEPIGLGTLREKDRYELSYENVSYGQHWVTALVTDNQGRPGTSQPTNFHVNGQARAQISSPKANEVISGPLEELVVTVHASDPTKQIKKVTVHLGVQLGGLPQEAKPTATRGEYTTTFTNMSGAAGTLELYAVVTDEADVETLTWPIQVKVTEPPSVQLYYVDGEYAREIQNLGILSAPSLIKLTAKVSHSYYVRSMVGIAKVEFYANDKLICVDSEKDKDV